MELQKHAHTKDLMENPAWLQRGASLIHETPHTDESHTDISERKQIKNSNCNLVHEETD